MKAFCVFSACFFLKLALYSQTSYWRPLSDNSLLKGPQQIRLTQFSLYELEITEALSLMKRVPHESRRNEKNVAITLPAPDGQMLDFRIFESDVMAEGLKSAFPHIRTFVLQGIKDKSLSGTLDWNDFGLHAMIFTPRGVVFIDPYSSSATDQYQVYYAHDFKKEMARNSSPDYLLSDFRNEEVSGRSSAAPVCVGSQLRTYRLAIACNGEYAKAATGLSNPSLSQTLSKVVTTVTRVNGIYEKELSVRLQLVPSTTVVLYTNENTDPFSNQANSTQILSESQALLTSTIGSSNFDIGHTFTGATGGLATLGCVCKDSEKGRGTTGLPNPFGDPFDVDFVAHEIGHQFNAKHSYNAVTGNCSGQRDALTAVEPGSGVTIMGYAGICGTNDLAANSLPYFHTISFDQLVKFITSANGGCASVSNTGNQAPVVNVTPSHVIPAGTPFVLEGSATDPDGDQLTFSWEEADVASVAGNWNSDQKPFFRSYTPVVFPRRYFPSEAVVLSGDYKGTRGEFLTSTPQNLQFRLTARDNRAGGGGVCYNTTSVSLVGGGAFQVTYPSGFSIGWPIKTQKTITWNVNATASAPVNCDSVRILLSYDGGQNYGVLVGTTPNDGSHTVIVPTVTADVTTCRIKVECRNNIFYDVSDNDFTISPDPNVGVMESGISVEKFKCMPNPFSDKITIAPPTAITGEWHVTVFNMTGSTVFNGKYFAGTAQVVDLSIHPPGIYLLFIQSGVSRMQFKAIKE